MIVTDNKKTSCRSPSRRQSDDEPGAPPTSPTSPLAPFPPPPPVESRSRAPEFYGFVAWAVTYLLFILYVLWAILPDESIVWLGVTWYPNRCVHTHTPTFSCFPLPLTSSTMHDARPVLIFCPSIENGRCSSRHGRS